MDLLCLWAHQTDSARILRSALASWDRYIPVTCQQPITHRLQSLRCRPLSQPLCLHLPHPLPRRSRNWSHLHQDPLSPQQHQPAFQAQEGQIRPPRCLHRRCTHLQAPSLATRHQRLAMFQALSVPTPHSRAYPGQLRPKPPCMGQSARLAQSAAAFLEREIPVSRRKKRRKSNPKNEG